jgi:hypothetical protein
MGTTEPRITVSEPFIFSLPVSILGGTEYVAPWTSDPKQSTFFPVTDPDARQAAAIRLIRMWPETGTEN